MLVKFIPTKLLSRATRIAVEYHERSFSERKMFQRYSVVVTYYIFIITISWYNYMFASHLDLTWNHSDPGNVL